jgi:hypothetical protein
MNVVDYSCTFSFKYIKDKDWNFWHNLHSIISCYWLDSKTYRNEYEFF